MHLKFETGQKMIFYRCFSSVFSVELSLGEVKKICLSWPHFMQRAQKFVLQGAGLLCLTGGWVDQKHWCVGLFSLLLRAIFGQAFFGDGSRFPFVTSFTRKTFAKVTPFLSE
jgi:hypothetical protein